MISRLLLLPLFGTVLLLSNPANCQAADANTVPWDTLTAELQIIDALSQPDSVKSSLTQELFKRYNLSASAYRIFYKDFLNLPPEDQHDFLIRVKTILQDRMKDYYMADDDASAADSLPPSSRIPIGR